MLNASSIISFFAATKHLENALGLTLMNLTQFS
jgi:hypothetical protein